jgi:hypothetical protein
VSYPLNTATFLIVLSVYAMLKFFITEFAIDLKQQLKKNNSGLSENFGV